MSVDTWQEAVALMPAPPSVADYREAFHWATRAGVKVMPFIDEILDAYNADHARPEAQ